jgi:hypothetical protein
MRLTSWGLLPPEIRSLYGFPLDPVRVAAGQR